MGRRVGEAGRDSRSRILAAAREAFGTYGFTATTTRSVAQRAKVSEPTIYRQFSTKQALFESAVLTPFMDFLDRHVTEWSSSDPGTLPAIEVLRRFYGDLVELFLEERKIMVVLLAATHFGDTTPTLKTRLEAAMGQIIAVVEQRVDAEAKFRGYAGFDISALVRVMVGMAFSTVTFPWLLATDALPRTRLVDEMARMTLSGTEFRDRTDSGTPSPKDRRPLPNPKPIVVRQRLEDSVWTWVSPLIAAKRTSRKGPRRVDDRTVLEGILHVLITEGSWAELPTSGFGVSGITCWRRLAEWRNAGVWPAVVATLRTAGIDLPEK
jgi:AcrR family transcriptional regulator/transposase